MTNNKRTINYTIIVISINSAYGCGQNNTRQCKVDLQLNFYLSTVNKIFMHWGPNENTDKQNKSGRPEKTVEREKDIFVDFG